MKETRKHQTSLKDHFDLLFLGSRKQRAKHAVFPQSSMILPDNKSRSKQSWKEKKKLLKKTFNVSEVQLEMKKKSEINRLRH